MNGSDLIIKNKKNYDTTPQEPFDNLLSEVEKRNDKPQDHYEVAAIIESLGWNDTRVSETFGFEDVFELAYEIFINIKGDSIYRSITPKVKTGFLKYTGYAVKNFLRGVIFTLPMAVSVIAMLTLRFSLWSYINLSLELATSIAIGTILSFMTVGGFTQAIARKGFLYVKQGYYQLARRITFKFIRLGYTACFIISLLMLFANFFIEAFPFRMIIIIVLYYFFLCSIWLSITVMYILEKELIFTGITILGILNVYVFFILLKFDIIVSQLITLTFVSILSMLYIQYIFRTTEKKQEKGIAPSLPRMSITLYTILPYFAYGFLYFTMLFTDRVIAWSTNDIYMPYIIWFRGEYEIGLDFALCMLMIPMGLSELIVNKLMADIEKDQKNYMGYETGKMNRHFLSIYYKRLPVISIISALSAVLIYHLVTTIDHIPFTSVEVDLITSNVTEFVFIVALISYALIAVALMNAVILFSLSQPEIARRSTMLALAANVVVGFLLSRWIEYYYAVFGLLAGAVVFLIMTTIMVRKVIIDLDYYLYAAA